MLVGTALLARGSPPPAQANSEQLPPCWEPPGPGVSLARHSIDFRGFGVLGAFIEMWLASHINEPFNVQVSGFGYVHRIEPSPLSHSRTFSSPQKETPHPMHCYPPHPLTTINLLSLWVYLCWASCTNGTIKFLAFCVASFTEHHILQLHPCCSMS